MIQKKDAIFEWSIILLYLFIVLTLFSHALIQRFMTEVQPFYNLSEKELSKK